MGHVPQIYIQGSIQKGLFGFVPGMVKIDDVSVVVVDPVIRIHTGLRYLHGIHVPDEKRGSLEFDQIGNSAQDEKQQQKAEQDLVCPIHPSQPGTG
jgi:hypothetical protein